MTRPAGIIATVSCQSVWRCDPGALAESHFSGQGQNREKNSREIGLGHPIRGEGMIVGGGVQGGSRLRERGGKGGQKGGGGWGKGNGGRGRKEKGKTSRKLAASCLAEAYFFSILPSAQNSGTKKEPKPKLLSPDIFRWGRGLPHKGVGAKKFGMPLETREIKLFWRDIPGFRWDIPGVPEKFEKKKFGFNFRSLKMVFCKDVGVASLVCQQQPPNEDQGQPRHCRSACQGPCGLL